MVVHREPEQDHEEEQRQPRSDAAGAGEAEQRRPMPVLEHGHEHAVGGGDREQVEDDRLDRDHDRAEGDQQEQERQAKHEPEHERCVVREHGGLVVVDRGVAGDVGADAAHLAERARDQVFAQRVERPFEARSLPLPASGMATTVTVWAALVSVVIGWWATPAASAWSSSVADGGLHRRSGRVLGLHHHDRGHLGVGERLLQVVVDGDARQVGRKVVRAGGVDLQMQRRRGDREQHEHRADRRDAGPAKHAVEHERPDARLGARGAAAPERDADAALVDVPAEQREHGRERGQRAQHRDGHDHDRADGERCGALVAGQELPGHRDHHGEAGDEDRAPGRRRGDLDRSRARRGRRGAPRARA